MKNFVNTMEITFRFFELLKTPREQRTPEIKAEVRRLGDLLKELI